MGDRSCLTMLIKPKKKIKTYDFFINNSQLMFKSMLEDFYKCTEEESDILKELLDKQIKYTIDVLFPDTKYLIILALNSAGYPQSLEVYPITGIFINNDFEKIEFTRESIYLPS